MRYVLLYLTQWLAHNYSSFNEFQYITLRAILGVLTAMVFSIMVGPYMFRRLSLLQIGQQIRELGPQSHQKKAGTPTMGGALFLIAVAISTLLWADHGNRHVWVVLIVTLLFGVIGWWGGGGGRGRGGAKGRSARAGDF